MESARCSASATTILSTRCGRQLMVLLPARLVPFLGQGIPGICRYRTLTCHLEFDNDGCRRPSSRCTIPGQSVGPKCRVATGAAAKTSIRSVSTPRLLVHVSKRKGRSAYCMRAFSSATFTKWHAGCRTRTYIHANAVGPGAAVRPLQPPET